MVASDSVGASAVGGSPSSDTASLKGEGARPPNAAPAAPLPSSSSSSSIGFLKDFISGGVSGAIVKTTVAPLERVKLLLQTQSANTQLLRDGAGAGVRRPYSGIVDCARRVAQEQGVLSFWRGNFANVVRYIPHQALNFSLKDLFKASIAPLVDTQDKRVAAGVNLASSGLAGAVALAMCYPLDMARTRLAADVGSSASSRLYSGLSSCIYTVYSSSGLSGVYAGFVVSLWGAVLFRALYMGGYDVLKREALEKDSSIMKKYLVAQSVTTIVGTACYPIDTVKRQMMIQEVPSVVNGTDVIRMRSAREVAEGILRRDGAAGFYRGLSANLMRGVGGAALLVTYDEVKGFVHGLFGEQNSDSRF